MVTRTSSAELRRVVWELGLLAVAITLIPVAQLMSGCVLGMAFLGFPQDEGTSLGESWQQCARREVIRAEGPGEPGGAGGAQAQVKEESRWRKEH